MSTSRALFTIRILTVFIIGLSLGYVAHRYVVTDTTEYAMGFSACLEQF